MKISEEQLEALVLRVLRELEAEQEHPGTGNIKQSLYMVCMSQWNDAYAGFLSAMDHCGTYDIYPVIPLSWEKKGYKAVLGAHPSCKEIRYRSCEKPSNLEQSVTVFPVVTRDMLAKAALCISDTFETSWIESCISYGSKAIFLRSGLARFSGREPAPYVEQVMGYYRKVLEYGIEILGAEELAGVEIRGAQDWAGTGIRGAQDWAGTGIRGAAKLAGMEKPGPGAAGLGIQRTGLQAPGFLSTEINGKKRVITASNVEQFASGGVIFLHPGDIVTDLARDKAKFLNIAFE